MFTWVDDIRELYRLNTARLREWDERLPLDQQSSGFAERQYDLEMKLSQMQEGCEAYLQETELHTAKQKVLSSLHNHWDGLTVFVERPEVAMDNNTAEVRFVDQKPSLNKVWGIGPELKGGDALRLENLIPVSV